MLQNGLNCFTEFLAELLKCLYATAQKCFDQNCTSSLGWCLIHTCNQPKEGNHHLLNLTTPLKRDTKYVEVVNTRWFLTAWTAFLASPSWLLVPFFFVCVPEVEWLHSSIAFCFMRRSWIIKWDPNHTWMIWHLQERDGDKTCVPATLKGSKQWAWLHEESIGDWFLEK